MKTISHFARKNSPLLCIAVSAGLAGHMVAADGQDAAQQQSEAYRQAVMLESVQKDMAATQAELASMRAEMKELLPGDVAVIDNAFKQIDSLSRNEMNAAIASLRAASRTGDLKAQLEKLSDAFKSQTAAISETKRIAGDLSARAIRDDMIQKLDGVLKRQAADMDEVARIALASNQPPAMLSDALMRRHQVVSGDQVSVTDDVNICIQEITDSAAGLPDDARKFMTDAGTVITREKLAETAGSAVILTRDGPFAQAVAAQASTVDTLAMVIHALSSDEQTLDQLRQMSSDLGTMTDEQTRVQGAMQAERRAIAYPLQSRQGDLSDSTTALTAEVKGLNAQAAGETQSGRDSMEKVVSITAMGNRADRTAIAPAQQFAVEELVAAKRDLDKQITEIEAAMQKNLVTTEAGTTPPADGANNPANATTETPDAQTAGAPAQGTGDTGTGAQDAGAPGQGTAAGLGDGNSTGPGQQGAGTQGTENTALTGTGQVAGGGTPGGLNYIAGFGRSDVGSVQVVTGLNSHDRAAVAQLQDQKPPREFAPDVQQYYKNLADGSGLQ